MNWTPGSIKARAEADSIVARLLTTDATCKSLGAAYGCNPDTIEAIYAARTTREQRLEAATRKSAATRTGVRTGRVPPHAFKAGQLRGAAARRYLPVGTVRVHDRPNGRPHRWIKVADVPNATAANWMLYSTWRWEQLHGPVPAGHRVRFADGDTLNDDPSNLLCVPRQESALRARRSDPALAARWADNVTRGMRKVWAAKRLLGEQRKAVNRGLFERQAAAGMSCQELTRRTGIERTALSRMRRGKRVGSDSDRRKIEAAVASFEAERKGPAARATTPKQRAAARVADFLAGLEQTA